jgi:hypothetical protein
MKAADIPRLYVQHGSLKGIQRATGESWRQVTKHYHAAVEAGLMKHLNVGRKTNEHLKKPSVVTTKQRVQALKAKRVRHKTYILTSAQNNTHVHSGVWQNLQALAKFMDAKVLVSTFLYANRSHWQKNLDKARAGKTFGGEKDELWFDPAIIPYINNERLEIAKGLVWAGELNIIPTAASPLSGLEVYTGRASMIVPHPHLAMDSIATVGGRGAKLNFTTGAVTQRNYIQRKEGFKAEFHHHYGALLVEVDEAWHWWVRQLNADSEGTIYDLDVQVKAGIVSTGHHVEAITMGDVHVANIDPAVKMATWGHGGMVDTLQPRYQFVHDVLDFHSRGHHRIKDPYAMLERHVQQRESVKDEVNDVRDFLREIKRKGTTTVVVDSNHDRHLERWLVENDGRKDPVNSAYWSLLNHWITSYITHNGEKPSSILGLALTMPDPNFEEKNNLVLLPGDASFVIAKDHGGGIECGLHGDQGANGARGSAKGLSRLGRRMNIGHSHSARIVDGTYQAGTSSLLQLEYNHGPSSWTHSHIVTYPNGKRAIITIYAGKWRA